MIKKRRKFAKNDFEVSAWVSFANIVQHIPEDPLRWLQEIQQKADYSGSFARRLAVCLQPRACAEKCVPRDEYNSHGVCKRQCKQLRDARISVVAASTGRCKQLPIRAFVLLNAHGRPNPYMQLACL